MAVVPVGGAVGTSSATLPTFTPGDIAYVWAFRDGSTTAPTLPAGWTNLNATGANTASARVAYRELQAGDTTTDTWANATSVEVEVYRGVMPGGNVAVNGGSSTTVNYPALTLVNSSGSSRVLAFAGHRSTNTALETPPTGMVNLRSSVDATDHIAGHDTNGGVTAWTSQNVSVGGTSSGWRTAVIELLEKPPPPESSLEFVAARGETFANSGTISFALPAGIEPGDTIWLAAGNGSTSAYEVPQAGWEQVSVGGSDVRLLTGMALALFRRVRVLGDSDSVSLSNGGVSAAREVGCIVLRGCGDATDFAINGSGFGISVGTQSVDVPLGGGLLTFSIIGNQDNTFAEPAGMTEPSGILASANFSSVSGAYALGLPVASYSKSSSWAGGSPLATILIAVDQSGTGTIEIAADAASVATAGMSLTTGIAAMGGAIGNASAALALATAILLSGSAGSASAATLGLTTVKAVSGSAAGTAQSGLALSTSISVSGAAASTATAGLALDAVPVSISGSAVANASATADLTTAITLTGSAAGSSTAGLALDTSIPLQGVAASESAAAMALSTGIALTGSASGMSDATAALTTAIVLTGNAQSVCAALLTLTDGADTAIAGSAASTAAASLQLTTAIPLSAAAAAQSAAALDLSTAIRLSGSAVSSAAATAALQTATRITGQGLSQSAALLTLEDLDSIAISGSAASVCAASMNLSTAIVLAGSSSGNSSASMSLTTVLPIGGAAAAQSSADMSLSTAIRINASAQTTAAAGMDLSTAIPISGSAAGSSAATMALSTSIALFGMAASTTTGLIEVVTAIRITGAAEAVVTASMMFASAFEIGVDGIWTLTPQLRIWTAMPEGKTWTVPPESRLWVG